MSDLYDSLEEDNVERNSSKSVCGRENESSESFRRFCDSDSADNYSFYLNEHLSEEKKDPLSVFSLSKISLQKTVTLPKIDSRSREKGVEPALNIFVDNKTLQEQGLQFNVDGSFTKSPRQDVEELPFIAREYRNLQFQKKKTYWLDKKISTGNCPKKTPATFAVETNTKPNMTHMTQVKKARKKSEELLMTERSSSTKQTLSRKERHSERKKNLTDSMKEKLLQTCTGDQERNAKRGASLLKAKQEIKSTESPQQGKDSTLRKKKSDVAKPQNLSTKENSHKSELNGKRKSKSIPQKVFKYKSDILLSARKPKLNYSERHQLESGYNPFVLRQENKKVLDDTDRSNFGDSVIEDLPEVSSRILSRDNSDLGGEDEEMFYRKLIERDKNLRQTLLSSRSEGPLETLKITEPNHNKGQKEGKTLEKFMKSKRNSKSLFIDMPSEGSHSLTKCKKCVHFCSGTATPKMSKTELALKAKTYGFLANARNLYKLKAQAEGRTSPMEREKMAEITGKITTTSPLDKLRKQNSLPVNGFPEVKPQLLGISPNFPRRGAFSSKGRRADLAEGSPKAFALPQVTGSDSRAGKMNERLFQRINSCLFSPHV